MSRSILSKCIYSTLLVAATSLLWGCSSTSEPQADANVADGPTVYEVDQPQDVSVDDLPTDPQNHQVELKASAPEQYVVQRGDTLWDLSSRFLVEPWFWPEIWYLNPQIANPHLIYPGDIVTVFYVGGKPYLTVGESPIGSERLSPSMRGEAIDTNEKQIPIQAIEQFLIRPRIVSLEELEQAPYIVGSRDNRIIYGSRDTVYVRGTDEDPEGTRYSIFRAGKEFRDPDSNELLGYEAIMVGDGELTRTGDPATLYMHRAEREALRGDRLLALEISEEDTAFTPHNPETPVDGKVISLFDAISQVGTYQIITINLGKDEGMEKGHVLKVSQDGRSVRDPFASSSRDQRVTLPQEESGVAMVFRTFDQVSYALVMNASHPIRVGDSVGTRDR